MAPPQNRTESQVSARHTYDRKKLRFIEAFALSTDWNPRNLEYPWYALWCFVLSNVTASLPNAFVAPQFAIWHTWEENKATSGLEPAVDQEQDVSDVERTTRDQQAQDREDRATRRALARGDTDLTQVPGAGNPNQQAPGIGQNIVPLPNPATGVAAVPPQGRNRSQSTSTVVTVAEPDASTFLVDFTINHAAWTEKDGNVTIQDVQVCYALEIKRSPSRRLTGEELVETIERLLNDARKDVMKKVAYLFIQGDSGPFRGLVAAGPYWSQALISRENFSPEEISEFRDPDYDLNPRTVELVQWSEYVRLGTQGSDDPFDKVYDFMSHI